MSSEGLRLRFKALWGVSRLGSHLAAQGLKRPLNWGETRPYVVILLQKTLGSMLKTFSLSVRLLCVRSTLKGEHLTVCKARTSKKTCFLNLSCKQNAHWATVELDQHSVLLKFLPHEHFQKNIHAQAEVVFFSFFCALQLALKMEWSLIQNSYLPFLEVSVNCPDNIQAYNQVDIKQSR